MPRVHVSFKGLKYMSHFIDMERTRKGPTYLFFFLPHKCRALTNLKLFHALRYQDNDTQRNKIDVWLIFGQTFHSSYCLVIYLFTVINCSQS